MFQRENSPDATNPFAFSSLYTIFKIPHSGNPFSGRRRRSLCALIVNNKIVMKSELTFGARTARPHHALRPLLINFAKKKCSEELSKPKIGLTKYSVF